MGFLLIKLALLREEYSSAIEQVPGGACLGSIPNIKTNNTVCSIPKEEKENILLTFTEGATDLRE